MHARIARYAFTGDAQEIARRAEEGMLPIFQSQPGFREYFIVESNDELTSFSAWESAAAAEIANATAARWVADNLADRVTVKDAGTGEILVATTLGISSKAGAIA